MDVGDKEGLREGESLGNAVGAFVVDAVGARENVGERVGRFVVGGGVHMSQVIGQNVTKATFNCNGRNSRVQNGLASTQSVNSNPRSAAALTNKSDCSRHTGVGALEGVSLGGIVGCVNVGPLVGVKEGAKVVLADGIDVGALKVGAGTSMHISQVARQNWPMSSVIGESSLPLGAPGH